MRRILGISRGFAGALAVVAGLAAAGPGLAQDVPPAGEETYPRTVHKVWYRTGTDRGITGPKLTGDLVITPETLEFLADKRDISIPFDTVRMVSLGQMRGDVDTEWVVLSIVRGGSHELVGLRDGRRLGYGQGTGELYDTLRATARRFSLAQFAAPEGFRPYAELDRVFALAVPASWSSYHHELGTVDGIVRFGTVVFTPPVVYGEGQSAPPASRTRDVPAELRQSRGTAWVIVRREVAAGMSCEGFARGGLRTLAEWIATDPFFGPPIALADPPPFEPVQIDGCAGLRVVARAPEGGDDALLLDLRVVVREDVVLLMGLRSTVARHERDRELFEPGVASLRLAVTR